MTDDKDYRNRSADYGRAFSWEAQRKRCALERLWEIAHHDSTVWRFLEAWRAGSFPSFEEMLCQLAAQLATEKADYLKTATKAFHLSPLPPVIIKGDITEEHTGQ